MNNYSKLLENNRQEALKIAKEKNLKSLPSSFVATKIIEIPKQGIEYKSGFGPLIEKPIIDIDNIFDDRKEYIGCYNINNGMIAYVDGQMKTYLAYYTNENIKTLKEAGYQENEGMPVPYTSMTEPVNEYIKMNLDKIITEGRKQREIERYERKLSEAHEIANFKRLEELPKEFKESLSLTIPEKGIEIVTFLGKETMEYPLIRNDDEIREREYLIGGYDVNNGKIVYVDENMVTRITYYTKEAEDLLINSGYTKEGMYVPLSNGEEPTNKYLKEKLEWIKENSYNLKDIINENSSKIR